MDNYAGLSHIEKSILLGLLDKDSAAYAQLKPEHISGDEYNYYLKKLLRLKLVAKEDKSYRLTTSGKKMFEETAPFTIAGAEAGLFKVRVLLIVCKGDPAKPQQILLQKRLRHPFLNETGILGGSLMKGESVVSGVERILFQETGLKAQSELLGLLRKIRSKDGIILSDSFFHVYLCHCVSGELITDQKFCENYWSDIPGAIQAEQSAQQGSPMIIKLLQELAQGKLIHPGLFYKEELVTLTDL